MTALKRPIAIYYEHPHWFDRLFAEMDRRGTSYQRVDATQHSYDIEANANQRYSLVFNRMSPSAYTRGHGHGIYYTVSYLEHLERLGVRVINGSRGFRNEISKASQLSLLQSLGLTYPRARVINHPEEAPAAAEGFRFPVIVKPNVGGSGKGIVRFDSPAALAEAAKQGKFSLGLDNTALVQEFIPARDGHITRVEVVGGKYLYAINVYITGETFDLCPADICKTTGGVELNLATCAVEAPKAGLRVEGYTPPAQQIHDVERIMQTAGIDVGGIEYIVDDRDGKLYYYDINALSNFVSDGPRVIGFDPFVKLVDYLEQQAQESLAKEAAA
ncbi:MAG: ATP-grasp domain-containing protein [Acidobacteria bacterium]|nr:ATP-grasp domain-containing protein [Acidobacteriota bacterium]MBV9435153.1 ATP-grasp domain-containing protein [Acidobacteriota bacterium]